MPSISDEFEHWIRSDFVEINTALEELYFQLEHRDAVCGVGIPLKEQLRKQGENLVARLAKEGNTNDGFDNAFGVLGNLGLFLASLRRHELTNPDRESASPFAGASALGMHIASSLGVVPRFATGHLTTHNRAVNGTIKSFTTLPDELLFLEYNARGVLSYKRAAESLLQLVPLGISSPLADLLLKNAAAGLRDVLVHNKKLFDRLDVDRFFYNVRPYYKPYRVGSLVYRGANAGDFAGINVIDLLLGCCRANDPNYSQILVEKMLFMVPADQLVLKDCLRHRSFLDEFLSVSEDESKQSWFQTNAALFVEVCELHGKAAAQHHNMLVSRFIEGPVDNSPPQNLEQITASGPPLPVVLRSLERLRDLRMAAGNSEFETRHQDVSRLKSLLTRVA